MVGEGALDFAGILGKGVTDSIGSLYTKSIEVLPGIAIAIVLLVIGYVDTSLQKNIKLL